MGNWRADRYQERFIVVTIARATSRDLVEACVYAESLKQEPWRTFGAMPNDTVASLIADFADRLSGVWKKKNVDSRQRSRRCANNRRSECIRGHLTDRRSRGRAEHRA